MITNEVSANQGKHGSGQEPTNIERRTLIAGGLATLLAACTSPTESSAERLSSSGSVLDEGRDERGNLPSDPFIVVLKGRYQSVPAGKGPKGDLGLSKVHLSDGSYSRVPIYPVFGIRGSAHQDKSIGTFYVSLATNLCAYDLPGGAMAMQFIERSGTFPVVVPDESGRGQYLEGTIRLTILETTGIYKAFEGGHNIMVDKLHQLVAGPLFTNFPSSGYDEFCFCNISTFPT